MKDQPRQTCAPAISSTPRTTISLYLLVKKLQAGLLFQAAGKKSFIINAIHKSETIFAEENTLAYVIGSLLSNAVHSTSDCCIRVETASAGDQVQIRIRINSAYVYRSHIHIAGNFVDAANELGGNIALETERSNALTVVFSLVKNAA